MQIILTLHTTRGLSNRLHRRQQQPNQQADDCNHDQQFDDSETWSRHPFGLLQAAHGLPHCANTFFSDS
jgi:hypothetical protein